MDVTHRKLLTPSRAVAIALCSKHWMASELDRYIIAPLGCGWYEYEVIRDFVDAKANKEYAWAYAKDLQVFVNNHLSN